ncbi:enoyl-CoA hydratase-related protein [Polymorphobacter sp.]|uniref:enoyl-CoA hydratase-related protein n=1 Tax=Polymorphobacter sp. TaxID=1909290 RepID=UPI003F721B5E
MAVTDDDGEPLAWRRRKDQRPPEILTAARQLIEEHGAAGTSMAQIAKLSGISEATVYKYFSSKQDLINQVLAAWATPFVERLTVELSKTVGIRAQLTLIAVRFLRSIEETPKLHRVFYQELRWSNYRGSELHRLNHQFAQSVVDIVRQADAAGELRHGINPTMIRDMLFGGLEHITMRTSFIGRAIDVEAEAARYVDLILSGMLKPNEIATAPRPEPMTAMPAITSPAPGLIVERQGGALLLTINRPTRRNAIDAATSQSISAHIDEAEADPGIGCVILTGAGDIAFCAGMDLKEAAVIGAGQGLIPGRGFAGITERQRTKPLIAAINGIAVAGGFELALASDIIIAADHAQFGLSEVKRGMFAFAGGIQRLARQIPRSAAMSIILSGEPIPASRLFDLGVVSELVPADQLRARALAFAQAMLANSWDAIQNGKQLYDMAVDMPIPEALRVGKAIGLATLTSADTREGIAAFADNRTADFQRKA